MPMSAALAAVLAAALAAALLLAACAPKAPPEAPPATVIAARPLAPTATGAVSYAGEVRARYESMLSFRVDGKLVARPAHLGDAVRAGQLLARIDPGDSAASVAAATAALAAAEHRLTLARQQHDRSAAELKDDLVSRAEAEQTDSGFAVAQAEVEQRRQELALARNQSQYTDLPADHDGYITSENAEVGAVVKAGQAVLGLAWSGETDVVIDVPESRIAQMTRGQTARVRLTGTASDAPPDALSAASTPALTARVRDIAQAADPQSRTFRVKLALADARHARLGMTAAVVFEPRAPGSQLRIPATALFHAANAPAVWVVRPNDSTLQLRKVDVAAYGADTVTLADGLGADETVVVQGVHAVNAGQRVSVVPPRAETSPLAEQP
jgi:RND family efflux transporter MFP subunit